jgi:hypothetical protein
MFMFWRSISFLALLAALTGCGTLKKLCPYAAASAPADPLAAFPPVAS